MGIPEVNGFMASMTADGYAPKSVQGAFDVDMSRIVAEGMGAQAPAPEPAITFSADQLRAMLAVAERMEAASV